jgi:hypothetical protein
MRVGQIWDVDRQSGNLICTESWHVPARDYSELLFTSRGMYLSKSEELPGRALRTENRRGFLI